MHIIEHYKTLVVKEAQVNDYPSGKVIRRHLQLFWGFPLDLEHVSIGQFKNHSIKK